jgi:hypothetical protein
MENASPLDWADKLLLIAASNNGGFVVMGLMLVVLLSTWLASSSLARGRQAKLEEDLTRRMDEQLAGLRSDLEDHRARLDEAYGKIDEIKKDAAQTVAEWVHKCERLGQTVTALWTMLITSGDRRLAMLPKLSELLDGSRSIGISEAIVSDDERRGQGKQVVVTIDPPLAPPAADPAPPTSST